MDSISVLTATALAVVLFSVLHNLWALANVICSVRWIDQARAAELHRSDTHHGLRWDGPRFVPMVYGLKSGRVPSFRELLNSRIPEPMQEEVETPAENVNPALLSGPITSISTANRVTDADSIES